MNIIEAIKSGKRYRKKDDAKWRPASDENGYLKNTNEPEQGTKNQVSLDICCEITPYDAVRDDWETEN